MKVLLCNISYSFSFHESYMFFRSNKLLIFEERLKPSHFVKRYSLGEIDKFLSSKFTVLQKY